jgi:hypothetical protein
MSSTLDTRLARIAADSAVASIIKRSLIEEPPNASRQQRTVFQIWSLVNLPIVRLREQEKADLRAPTLVMPHKGRRSGFAVRECPVDRKNVGRNDRCERVPRNRHRTAASANVSACILDGWGFRELAKIRADYRRIRRKNHVGISSH